MEIVEVKTQEQMEEMIKLSEKHPREYDCTLEQHNDLFRQIYKTGKCRTWVSYENGKSTGYAMAIRTFVPMNEIYVVEIFIDEGSRSIKNVILLTAKLKEWAIADKALRIRWTTKRMPKTWARLFKEKLSVHSTLVWEVN
jgi:hypothetical protein